MRRVEEESGLTLLEDKGTNKLDKERVNPVLFMFSSNFL